MSTFGSRRPDDDDTDEPATTDYMTNTSTVDVTEPLPNSSTQADVDPRRESPLSTYNRAWLEQVEPVAQQIVLEAGDILVMPPGSVLVFALCEALLSKKRETRFDRS